MMYCTNCGKEMPDDSRFCTSCGKKMTDNSKICTPYVGGVGLENSQKMIKLIVTRKKSMLGMAVPMKVLIDGNQIASLKNDNSVEIDLPVGEHKMIIDTIGEVTEKMLNLTPEFSKVHVTLKMKMGLVTGKASIESIEKE